jgi:hypothetical protein
MNPSAWFHDRRRARGHDDEGIAGAVVIAVLFALLALASFIIDQSLPLQIQPPVSR